MRITWRGGAPLNACLRPVPGRKYFRLTLGVLPGGLEAAFHDPRWVRLLQGLRQAQARVLLRVTPDPAAIAAVRGWVDVAWLLGETERVGPAVAALGALPVAVRLVPVGSVRPTTAAAASAEPPGATAARDSGAAPTAAARPAPVSERPELAAPGAGGSADPVRTPAPRWGAQPADVDGGARSAPTAARPAAGRAAAAARPAARRPATPATRRRSPETLVSVGVVGALVLGIAGWLVLRRTEPRPTPAVAAIVAGTPTGVPLPFSVRLRIFPSREEAEAEIARLRQQASLRNVPLYISVERVEDVLYYRVLAGFFADTAAAKRLRDRLLRDGLVEPDPSGPMALIETVPMAFELGRFATAADAERQVELWRARGIPTYAVPVPYVDGVERWHVYAGAYRDEVESRALRALLERAGLPARLVARTGRAG